MTSSANNIEGQRSTADPRKAMEQFNTDAARLHIWLRTESNRPSQQPWLCDSGLQSTGKLAGGRVAAGQLKPVPHRWRWSEIAPYVARIAQIARSADVPILSFAERQQLLLVNPGLGGRLQVSNTIRCAVSVYNPGDTAPVHRHTPNASRTVLADQGGYTTVDGEHCDTRRGDLILTPAGTWHGHGNEGSDPAIWVDILDWPLLEFLDCIWVEHSEQAETKGTLSQSRRNSDYSQGIYGHGGMLPGFAPHARGIGPEITPMIHYRGTHIREALADLDDELDSPYEGMTLRLVNPATGGSVFPTLDYSVVRLRPGQRTQLKRETSSTLYVVMEGRGETEVGAERFDWEANDIFVVPGFHWRRSTNVADTEAILYRVSDRPLLQSIGQYRAQGRPAHGSVVELFS